MHLNHRRNKIFTYSFICLFYIGGQFVHFFVLVHKVNSFEKEEKIILKTNKPEHDDCMLIDNSLSLSLSLSLSPKFIFCKF